MRLIIEIGYDKLLLAEDADTSAFLKAIAGATCVETKSHTYPKPDTYFPKPDAFRVVPMFVPDNLLVPEEQAAAETAEELKARNLELSRESQETKATLKALEAKVAELIGGVK